MKYTVKNETEWNQIQDDYYEAVQTFFQCYTWDVEVLWECGFTLDSFLESWFTMKNLEQKFFIDEDGCYLDLSTNHQIIIEDIFVSAVQEGFKPIPGTLNNLLFDRDSCFETIVSRIQRGE